MEIVREEDWVSDGEYKWAAIFEMTTAEIAAINNLVPVKWDDDGLGEVEGLLLRDSTGRQLLITQHLQHPDPVWAKRTELKIVRDGMTVYEVEALAARMASELEISIDKLVMYFDNLDEWRAQELVREMTAKQVPTPAFL